MGGATPGMVNYGGLSSQQTPQGYGSMSSPQGYNAWMQNFLQSLYSPQQQQWQNANALMGGYGQGAGDLVGSYNPYAAIPAGATRQAPAPNVAPVSAPVVEDPSTMVDPNAVAMLSASESGAGNKRGGRVGRAPGGMAGDPQKAIRRATMVAKSIARDVGPIPSQPAAPAVHPASMVPGVHVASEPQHFAEGGDVGIPAFHSTNEPFENYNWQRLGQTTRKNITDANDPHSFGMALASLGPWANERDLSKQLVQSHAMPVRIGGKGKQFRSLEELHNRILKHGGAENFRNHMLRQGFGHIAVNDEEMGGKSYVALHPEAFKIHKAEGGDVEPTDETGFDAWHGTPHEFPAERLIQHPTGEQEHIPASQPVPGGASVIKEFPLGRFRSDRIGTSEGAQAYGHGLYLGEEPTARVYRQALSGDPTTNEGKKPNWQSRGSKYFAQMALAQSLDKKLSGDEAIKDAMQDLHRNAAFSERKDIKQRYYDAVNSLSEMLGKPWKINPGHIYHVRVNANPEHFLDWDKPLSEQSEHVQKALEALHGEKMGYNSQILHPSNKGDNLYYTLALRFGRTREAHAQPTAAALHAAGIPGIRYLDANSRGPTGNPTHNHVIFDPSIIDIKRRYKRGGAVERHGYRTDGAVQEPSVSSDLENYQDPPSSRLAGWNWTPLAEVHKSLGSFSEIPSHIQNFGHFMNETAKKAATTGLTPRDLIKAYAITRSSIQREGRTPQKIMEHWPDFPGPKTGVIRPEGAMGEWLQTPMGQRYLDAAVKGNVDHDAVKDAIQSMKAFGLSSSPKQPTGEQQYLPYAAQMLPGQEKHVSDMVTRAIHSDSAPQEWRDWAMKLSGIKYAKAGFLSSLLGRGDQPTADAREYNVHSGMTPGKERNKLIAKGQVDPVLRLAARHSALNIKMPSELQPHYQHLVHHAVWEHGGEPVTHEDIINAMRHAASGGEIDSPSIHNHILVHAMRATGLPGLEDYAHGGTVDQALSLTRRYARG